MSNWAYLKSTIKWPKGFLYVVENEGTENKFGYSFIIKFNGNIIKEKLREQLKEVNKLTEFTEDRCKEFELEMVANDLGEEDAEEQENENRRNIYLLHNSLNYTSYHINDKTSENDFNIQEANQILLRLHDKQKYIEEQLNTTHFIDHKYDIVLNESPNFLFRLDNPLLNVTYDPLLSLLKKYYDSTHNIMNTNKRKSTKNTKKNGTGAFKSYLYNMKIMESEETIIDEKTFIYAESGTSDLKIKLLVQEGKNIQRILLQYKLDYEQMLNEEEEQEQEEEQEEEQEQEHLESKRKNSKHGINEQKDISNEQKKNADETNRNQKGINEKKKKKTMKN